MAPDNADRSVHSEMTFADGDVGSVVRYHKGGKWWWETTGTGGDVMSAKRAVKPARKIITLSEAVALTLKAHYSTHGEWFRGRPGGRTLDARVLAAIVTRKGRR